MQGLAKLKFAINVKTNTEEHLNMKIMIQVKVLFLNISIISMSMSSLIYTQLIYFWSSFEIFTIPIIMNKNTIAEGLMKLMIAIIALALNTSVLADVGHQPQDEECIIEGSQIHLMGKLISMAPISPDEKDSKQSKFYWILSTDKLYCGEGYNSETRALYRLGESISRFQLILKPEQYEEERELLGKKVIVEGKVRFANSDDHHTQMLIDVNTIESANCNPGSMS
ncbi:MAG: DUF4431 domain-containing protein [Legionella sp.]|nr:MAG: DUF4431 domain-containing protein [Legionella sp.]